MITSGSSPFSPPHSPGRPTILRNLRNRSKAPVPQGFPMPRIGPGNLRNAEDATPAPPRTPPTHPDDAEAPPEPAEVPSRAAEVPQNEPPQTSPQIRSPSRGPAEDAEDPTPRPQQPPRTEEKPEPQPVTDSHRQEFPGRRWLAFPRPARRQRPPARNGPDDPLASNPPVPHPTHPKQDGASPACPGPFLACQTTSTPRPQSRLHQAAVQRPSNRTASRISVRSFGGHARIKVYLQRSSMS